MKKIILTILCLPILSLTAHGAFLHVETITPFSTEEPPEMVKLKALGELQLTQDILIQNGDILVGELTNVKHPRRLKRNATFKYKINYIKPVTGKSYEVTEHNVGKYLYEIKIDKRKMITNTALKVGEQFASGITVSYRAIEGAVENRSEGVSGAARGAVENVYDNSIFSYIKKGIEIQKKAGDKFYLSLKPEKQPKTHAQIESQNDAFIEAAQSGLDR